MFRDEKSSYLMCLFYLFYSLKKFKTKSKETFNQPLKVSLRFYLDCIATTTAKKATPSTKAAATIIKVKNFPYSSGCLADDSNAEDPILPIPNPAPITAKPAPIPAPNDAGITFSFNG